MAERLDIVVTKTGDREAAQGIRGIGDAAQQTDKQVGVLNSTLGFMKAAIAGLGVGVLINSLREQSDTYASLINRLKLVSTSQEDLIKTEQALFDISQRTRASFQQTGNLYNKLAIQAGNLGIETKDLLPTIETINKAIAVSGATSNEASAGLLQFSQGLASNRFQGDELRSVLENLPQLGVAIAKGLGVTTAELRKMGEQGELTTKKVLDALQKSAPEIAKQFAAITPTIGQAFQVLQNSLLRFIGQADQASGVSRTLAQGLVFLAENLNTIIGLLLNGAAAFIAFKTAGLAVATLTPIVAALRTQMAIASATATLAAGGIGMFSTATVTASRTSVILNATLGLVKNAFVALWTVIRANPFVFLATVITAAVTALYMFGNAVRINSSGSISLLGAVVGSVNYLISKLGELYNWIIGPLSKAWTFVKGIAGDALQFIANGFQKLIDLLPDFIKNILKIGELGGAFKEFRDGITKSMEDATRSFDRTGLSAANLGGGFKDAADDMVKGAEGAGQKIPPPFERIIKKQDELKVETEQTSNLWRNAFGDMIEVTDEWARRSGAAFNSVKDGAAAATSAVTTAQQTVASSSGSSSSGSGSSGSGGGDFTIANAPTAKEIIDGLGIHGISRNQAQQILNKAETANSMMGTPAGVRGIQQFYALLKTLPVGAAKLLQSAYSNISQYFPEYGLEGFRKGGSFTVGGAGGPDSQLVQFMATPGERVNVQTPQQVERQSSPGGAGQRPVQVNMTVVTKDADSFRRSEQQILTGLVTRVGQVAARI